MKCEAVGSVKIVEALSQVTVCVVDKVEKQPVLTMWDKVKLWSPEMHHNVLHGVTAGFKLRTHGGELVKRIVDGAQHGRDCRSR